MEEKILLSLLKDGDINAFNVLFRRYAAKLYYFSITFFYDKTESEEIVQETFVRLWETREKVDTSRKIDTYLYTIARSLIYSRFRHQMVEQKYSDYILQSGKTSYNIENDLVLKELRTHILSGILKLPPQQREILQMKHSGYDNEEIAEKLNLSKRTIEAHINKAFKFLRVYLREQGEVILLVGILFNF